MRRSDRLIQRPTIFFLIFYNYIVNNNMTFPLLSSPWAKFVLLAALCLLVYFSNKQQHKIIYTEAPWDYLCKNTAKSKRMQTQDYKTCEGYWDAKAGACSNFQRTVNVQNKEECLDKCSKNEKCEGIYYEKDVPLPASDCTLYFDCKNTTLSKPTSWERGPKYRRGRFYTKNNMAKPLKPKKTPAAKTPLKGPGGIKPSVKSPCGDCPDGHICGTNGQCQRLLGPGGTRRVSPGAASCSNGKSVCLKKDLHNLSDCRGSYCDDTHPGSDEEKKCLTKNCKTLLNNVKRHEGWEQALEKWYGDQY